MTADTPDTVTLDDANGDAFTVTLPLSVTSTADHIYAETADGYEVFYWAPEEWENPDNVPPIADMVDRVHTDPESVIRQWAAHLRSHYAEQQTGQSNDTTASPCADTQTNDPSSVGASDVPAETAQQPITLVDTEGDEFTVTPSLSVTSTDDHIYAETADGYEVFYWARGEWERDPALVPTIINMVNSAHAEPAALIRREAPHVRSAYVTQHKDDR